MRIDRIGGGVFIEADCFDAMKEIPSGSVDMVLADLPYGTTACKWDAVLPFESLWAAYARLCSGAVVLTASQPFTSALVLSNPRHYRHSWIWNKKIAGNFATAKVAPMKIHEDILVFSKNKVPYTPLKTKRDVPIKLGANKGRSTSAKLASAKPEYDGKVYDDKYPESILVYPRERGIHPTQKPVALFEYLIRTYTNEGDTVLDNTAGSGTTAIAAENTGRRWVCIENDPEYAEKARARIRARVEEMKNV